MLTLTRFIAGILSLGLLSACAASPQTIQGTDKGAAEIVCALDESWSVQYTPAEVKAIRVTLKDMGLKTVALQRTFQGSELSSRLSTRNGKRIFTCNLENLTFKDKNRQIEYAGTIEAFLDFSIGQVTLIGTAEIPAFIVKQNKVTDVSAGTLWLMPTPQPSNGSALIQLPIIDSVPATTTID